MDGAWVAEHTLGVDDLHATVESYTPEKVAEICGVDADDVRRAARIFGGSWDLGTLDPGEQHRQASEVLATKTSRQLSWLNTRNEDRRPQALLIAP